VEEDRICLPESRAIGWSGGYLGARLGWHCEVGRASGSACGYDEVFFSSCVGMGCPFFVAPLLCSAVGLGPPLIRVLY